MWQTLNLPSIYYIVSQLITLVMNKLASCLIKITIFVNSRRFV